MNSEERYNRWIDDTLPDREHAALQSALAQQGISGTEREAVIATGKLLRQHVPAMEHADPFLEQILDRIRSERAANVRNSTRRPAGNSLAWSGFGFATLAVVGFFLLIPKPWTHVPPSEVYSVWAESDAVSAVAVHTPDHSAFVVWLDGLDYIPADHAIQ